MKVPVANATGGDNRGEHVLQAPGTVGLILFSPKVRREVHRRGQYVRAGNVIQALSNVLDMLGVDEVEDVLVEKGRHRGARKSRCVHGLLRVKSIHRRSIMRVPLNSPR